MRQDIRNRTLLKHTYSTLSRKGALSLSPYIPPPHFTSLSLYLILSCEILTEPEARTGAAECWIIARLSPPEPEPPTLVSHCGYLVPEIRYLTSNTNTSAPCSNTFYCTKNKVKYYVYDLTLPLHTP